MSDERALALTFYGENPCVEVVVLSVSAMGLCYCRNIDNGKLFARHRDRLQPLNATARKLLADE